MFSKEAGNWLRKFPQNVEHFSFTKKIQKYENWNIIFVQNFNTYVDIRHRPEKDIFL